MVQSRNAYILGSFVIPEGAETGTRIEFDAENGWILIYDASDNLIISISPIAGTDADGNAILPGLVSYATPNAQTDTMQISTGGDIKSLPSPGRPARDVDGRIQFLGSPASNSDQSGSVSIFTPGNFGGDCAPVFQMASPSVDGVAKGDATLVMQGTTDAQTNAFRIRTGGYITKLTHISNDGTVQAEIWRNIPLAANWTADQPLQYRLFPDGTVRLRGIGNFNVSPIPAGTLLGTLPAGYRPAQYTLIPIAFDVSATKGRCEVGTNGQIRIYDAPNDLPCLDSVSFAESSLL